MSHDDTLECAALLARCFALMRGRTCAEVMRAVLASRTLAAEGYAEAQDGRLTRGQATAAVGLLHAWVGKEIERQTAERQRKESQDG